MKKAHRKSRKIEASPDIPLPSRPTLPAMEVEISFDPFFNVKISYARLKHDVLYRFQPDGQREDSSMSAYQIREVFLDVRTPKEALDFLGFTGYFRSMNDEFPKHHESLSWSDFRRWQQLIVLLMRKGPFRGIPTVENGRGGTGLSVPSPLLPIIGELSLTEFHWLLGWPDQIVIQPLPENPSPDWRHKLYAVIYVHSTLEAILATVYIDSLNGLRYERCLQCQKIFKIRSKHPRTYCTQKCAWIAGTQRRRKAAKERAK